MEIRVLDLYELKSEFLPEKLASHSVYVRPGELELYAQPDQWVYIGRAFHPTVEQAVAVNRYGYCSRRFPLRFAQARFGRTWYNHPSSVRARQATH